jgi:hypothetical protein
MTDLTLRRDRYKFVVTGPTSSRQAREWCRQHFHGSSIREEGPGGKRRPPPEADKDR